MPVWIQELTLADLNAIGMHAAPQNFGIHYTAFGEDWIEATIPLDSQTRSADGALHPGALSILAESIGLMAARLCIDISGQICLCQILHINYSGPITSGPIVAKWASPVSIVADRHVWNVEMKSPNDVIVSVARLTIAILKRTKQ